MNRPATVSDRDPPAVAVVGGGAVGVTAAADLAARGAAVALYDRGELGAASSGRAAGVLYDAYAAGVDATLAARAMGRFRAFDRSLPGFSFTPCPYVIAVRDGDPDADSVPAIVGRMRTHGRSVSTVDPASLDDRFPLVADDLAVAAVAEGAGWCDPTSYVAAMGERARRDGVDIETGTAVSLVGAADLRSTSGSNSRSNSGPGSRPGSDPDSEPAPEINVSGEGGPGAAVREFDAVVVAVGAHTAAFLADAGIDVPVVPYRVQALTSRVGYDGPMVYDATAGVYFRPHPTGLLAGDGTEPVAADPDDYDDEGDGWFVESVSETLRERADYDPDIERAWAGLCTATPDGDPLVGPIGDASSGLFVAAGWQGHGFMRAPAVGELIAEGVLASLDGDSSAAASPWIDAFDPDRFDGAETFDIAEGMSVASRADTEE